MNLKTKTHAALSGTFFMLLVFTLFLPAAAHGQELLRFKYRDGERYRIVSQNKQDVYLNEQLHHSATLLNRIQVLVDHVEGESGYLKVNEQYSAELNIGSGSAYQLAKEYSAEFLRDPFGKYTIDSSYFIPTVRDVPILPEKPVEAGDSWAAEGYEVHDFRDDFGIPDAYKFTMPVSYTYLGKETIDGIELDHIQIEYNVFYRKDTPPGAQFYPYLITGSSRQNYYFDNVLGRPHSYDEVYDFIFHLSDGQTVRYTGTASGTVIESEDLDRDAMKQDLQNALSDLGVEDSTVVEDERGVTISLENIQFQADSARLLPSELSKLDKIAGILRRYPDRDILVSGHTALAGTPAGRQQLSEDRARAVVEYLIAKGVRDPAHIMYQGFGAEHPVAPNDTAEGMSRNRRVEITILEN